MPRWLKQVGVFFAVVLGIVFALVALQTAATVHDRNRVTSMCARLIPGTPLANARHIITDAGVGHLLPPETGPDALGSYDEKEKNWFFSIPVAMEMGDERCAIYNNGKVVLKAEMEWL